MRFLFQCIFVAAILLPSLVYSQNQKISDSLRQVLDSELEIEDSVLYHLLRDVVINEGKPDVALRYGLELVELMSRGDNKRRLGRALDDVHLLHRQLGNIEEASKYYYRALSIFEELGRKDDLAASYAQEASLLVLEGQYHRSIDEYRKSIDLYVDLQDTLMANYIRVNLGETYRLFRKFDSSSYYSRQALLYNSIDDEMVKSYASGNLGMVYYALDQLDSARSLLETSISILEPLGDVYSVAVYSFELGKVLVAKGSRSAGEHKMLDAYQAALNEGLKEQVRDFSLYLATYYANQEDYRTALRYQRQYEIYKDSLINIDNVRKVEQLRGQHVVEQRDSEIAFLNELNKSQRNTLLAIGSGSVILLFLLGLLYRNNQEKKRANLALEKREKEKGLLLSELNHRTKNNLNMISSLLNLQSDELGDAPAAEAVRQGRYRVDSLALIHQKLYKEDYASIQMQPYLQELLAHLQESFDPDVTLDITIVPIKMKVDQAIPLALIVNELVTNALKYGKAPTGNSLIRVSLEAVGQDYRLFIRDNGPGMVEPQPDELSSFGLKLIYSLTDQLDGTLYFRNVNGAEWTITFPK